jgi:hypothetical protein
MCTTPKSRSSRAIRPRRMLLDIADALIAEKAPQATRKQAIDIQAAILAALRKRNRGTVLNEGAPARWRLAETHNAA